MYERILQEDGKQDSDNCAWCDTVTEVWKDPLTGHALCKLCIRNTAARRLFEAGMSAVEAVNLVNRLIP